MTFRHIECAAWMLFVFVSSLSQAQHASSDQGAGQTVATIRSNARLVTIDVVVTEGGRTVRGLSKDSFHVQEDGKEQEIKDFDEHISATGPPASVSGASFPPNIYTNAISDFGPPNVLLLDALNTPIKDQQYLRKEMVSYLREIPPGAQIAIFSLGSRLRMVQGFTADIRTLLAAIDTRKDLVKPSVLLEQQSDQETPMDESQSPNQTVIDVLDQFQAEITTVQYDLRIQTTLDAMKQLGAFLGSLSGRKNIIWLSGSFPLSLQPDESAPNPFITQRNYDAQLKQISDAFAADRIAVYPIDVRGTLPPAMFDAAGSSITSSGAPFRRTNRSAQPIAHAQNQSVLQTDAEHASMQQLAEGTGGHAFYESNGIKEAIAQAIEDGTGYYTLTYSPRNKDFNGKFRKIEVKLPSGKYHLSYRHGYYAQPSVNTSKTESADALISPSHPGIQRGAPLATQILFKARVLPAGDPMLEGFQPKPGPAGMRDLKLPRTRYCVDYAIQMNEVNVELGADHLYHSALELLVIAYDSDGKPVNLVDHPFQLTLKEQEVERIKNKGLNVREEIDVPNGDIHLRLAVYDLATSRLGSLEAPVSTQRQRK